MSKLPQHGQSSTPNDFGPTTYGTHWGPIMVERMAYVEGRGYVLEVSTEHRSMQVYVSEKGRVIRAYPAQKRLPLHRETESENDAR